MGTLFVVATPIGNLEDMSPRARRVLSEVSLIAAEDTRHTGMLLKRLGIDTPMLSNHGFNERARVDRFLVALEAGDVALVSDSGTPAISDPGSILVRAAADAGHRVVPVPGPSAVTAAISGSGLVDGPFIFLGFLPRSTGERRDALDRALRAALPLVIYESGPRMPRLARELGELASDRAVVVYRELTKLHEEAIRGPAAELPGLLERAIVKGEFAVVVGAGVAGQPMGDIDALIDAGIATGMSPSSLAKSIARQTGGARSEIYEQILKRSNGQGA
ncbi:MAG: 16S rRNA (cytidine(1402)-2'-O)-methyltransferase [Thermomicrobiales bacterium]|nr:16S rRNA (cytidine(1402)-2'-O)-methyltransferase [Thermomicrobiales bacterium]